MKKFVASVLALALCVALCATATAAYEGLYAKSAVVVEVDYESNVVTVKDYSNNLWMFEGCEDWLVGDLCAMVMHDNNTPTTIYDDVIVNVRYEGWVY